MLFAFHNHRDHAEKPSLATVLSAHSTLPKPPQVSKLSELVRYASHE